MYKDVVFEIPKASVFKFQRSKFEFTTAFCPYEGEEEESRKEEKEKCKASKGEERLTRKFQGRNKNATG